MGKLYAIFFSATDTTRKCVAAFCQGYGAKPVTAINLADSLNSKLPDFSSEDVVVVASPVYGGRLPKPVAEAFARLKGNNAAAVAIVVYGNRDYDDALLELTDILRAESFRIAGAGAFIGQHSIFPKVGKSRPDQSDLQALESFGKECKAKIRDGFDPDCTPFIKGKRPYKKAAGAPLWPSAKESDCVKCGTCASNCPVGAISGDKPFATDTTKCISCGRCISVCPIGVRKHSGVKYSLVGFLFNAAFSKRKEPEWVVAR